MGDRYTMYDSLKCPYCGKIQEEVWYADSCGATEHICEKCKKESHIKLSFELVKKHEFNKETEEKES